MGVKGSKRLLGFVGPRHWSGNEWFEECWAASLRHRTNADGHDCALEEPASNSPIPAAIQSKDPPFGGAAACPETAELT
jgi:hypothetical protein